ncbi:hypothetical protein SSX86_014081 [Deinandra increscens subsp. villosa]|uniref:Cyclin D3 n=1 Tax=Deinandra increscens subsp. villosa TaxID=3103831 RepID=A0AAP0D8W1_9ASTR
MMTILDPLYCEEKHQWEDDDDEDKDKEHPLENYSSVVVDDDEKNNINDNNLSNNFNNNFHPQHTLVQQDMFWEQEELSTLTSKESHQHLNNHSTLSAASAARRRDAVEWILTVVSHYSFSAHTAVLAVNYLDRFVDRFEEMETDKNPWVTQLAAVSCLSIAAKVEETYVPLLLDLQLDGSKHVFEAKTLQKMEILILSTLQWKMNPVTPLSFLDFVARRLGLKSNLLFEFINRCECLLLCFLSDERFRCYLPSVTAAATMIQVINTIEPAIGAEYQSQLLGILGINKDVVEGCRKHIREITCGRNPGRYFNKRKFGSVPGSPDAVMDLCFSYYDEPSVSSSSPGSNKKSRNCAT